MLRRSPSLEEKEAMVEKRRLGYSYNVLSIEYGVNRKTVALYCKYAGLPNRVKLTSMIRNDGVPMGRPKKYTKWYSVITVLEKGLQPKECHCGKKYIPTPRSESECLFCFYGKNQTSKPSKVQKTVLSAVRSGSDS